MAPPALYGGKVQVCDDVVSVVQLRCAPMDDVVPNARDHSEVGEEWLKGRLLLVASGRVENPINGILHLRDAIRMEKGAANYLGHTSVADQKAL